MPEAPLIHQRLLDVMRSVGAVAKDSTNEFHHFQYRSIDGLVSAVQPALIEHGVTLLPVDVEVTATERGNGSLVVRTLHTFRFTCAEDGSHVDVKAVGLGEDKNDKGANKAMSAALKYALLQALMIPVEGAQDDSDADGNPTPDYVVNGQAGPNADVTQVLTMLDGLPPGKRAEAEQILNSQLPQWRQGIPADKRDGVFGWLNDLFNQARAAS